MALVIDFASKSVGTSTDLAATELTVEPEPPKRARGELGASLVGTLAGASVASTAEVRSPGGYQTVLIAFKPVKAIPKERLE